MAEKQREQEKDEVRQDAAGPAVTVVGVPQDPKVREALERFLAQRDAQKEVERRCR